MENMSDTERRDFLQAAARTGKVATIRADGRPHLMPVWYVLDGDDIVFTTWHTTVKGQNLLRDPRVAFCVDDDRPPYAFVEIEGTAQVDTHPASMLSWTTRIATKYMGEELGESYGKRNAVEGEWLVRIKPTKIVAQKGIAD